MAKGNATFSPIRHSYGRMAGCWYGRSLRGGELWCEQHDDRVRIGGYAIEFLPGDIELTEEL